MASSKTKKTVSVKKPAPKKTPASPQKKPATSSKFKSVSPASKKAPVQSKPATTTATSQETPSTAPKKEKKTKSPRVKLDLSQLPSDINVIQKKVFTSLGKGDQKAYLRGSRVFLTVHKPEYGPKFTKISDEEAKKGHYGRTRSIGTVVDLDDLKRVLGLFYKN